MKEIDTDENLHLDSGELAESLGMSPELADEVMQYVSSVLEQHKQPITADDVTSFLQVATDLDSQYAERIINGLSFLARLKHVSDHQVLDEKQWSQRQLALHRAKKYNHMMEQAPPSLLEQQQTTLQRVLAEKSGQSSNAGTDGASLAEGSSPPSDKDTVTACGMNQWSDTGSTPCAPCSTCDGNEVMLMQCSASANTVCKKCEDGNCCDVKTRTFWTDGTSCGHIVGAPAFMEANDDKTELTVTGVCQSGTCILTAQQN